MARMLVAPVLILVLLAAHNPVADGKPTPKNSGEAVSPTADLERTEAALKQGPDASGRGETIRVLWWVSELVPGPKAVMSPGEADGLRGMSLNIDQDRIVFGRQSCHGVTFDRTNERLSDYLQRVHNVTPKELSLSDEVVQVIRTTCTIPGFQEYVRLNDRRLVICVKGVFFFLEPEVFQ